jgi:hypothetical protein
LGLALAALSDFFNESSVGIDLYGHGEEFLSADTKLSKNPTVHRAGVDVFANRSISLGSSLI